MRGEMEQDHQTRVLYELCTMIIHILRSPPLPISFPSLVGPAVSSLSSRTSQASPAAFASLFLGISVALMLFGSVTFVIGFFLMPLVIGLVMLFYFVGMLHNLSELGRTIFWPGYTSNMDVPGFASPFGLQCLGLLEADRKGHKRLPTKYVTVRGAVQMMYCLEVFVNVKYLAEQ